MIIRWSEYPDWIKLHDPLTGDWHEVRASECLPGVVETANKYEIRREARHERRKREVQRDGEDRREGRIQ